MTAKDYVALQQITHAGAVAYHPGDSVHPDNVEANGYEVGVQVAERDSAEAQTALRALGIIPVGDADQPDDTDGDGGEAPQAIEDVLEGTVDDVNQYLSKHPDQVEAVLDAERAGRGRTTILHGPHGEPPDVAES